MGLKIFQKVEQPQKEKSLEVMLNEEDILNECIDFFHRTKIEEDWPALRKLENYFLLSKNFLQSYKIKPKLISNFNRVILNDLIDTKKSDFKFMGEEYNLGIFLSTLIQRSYDSGFNNFEFDEIKAYWFGVDLLGTEDKPIIVKAKKINGSSTFGSSKYCRFETEEIHGSASLIGAEYCFLKTRLLKGNDPLDHCKNCFFEVETLEGSRPLANTKNCIVEITNFDYENYFGLGNIENCKIYLQDENLLQKLKWLNGQRGNITTYGNIPKELKRWV